MAAVPSWSTRLAAMSGPPLPDMDDGSSDGSYTSDSDGERLDLNTDLIGVRRATKDLNIVNRYRPHWGCSEAFREAYQNWRDGILRSFSLDLSSFHPTYTDTKRVILIETRHPETKELMGFIRFQYDKDGYCVGGLKMANFKATLKYRNLGTGGTTKANDKTQTGQHGDGLKLSALVFRRNNYNFHYESDGFKWRFLYKKGSLSCSLTRMSDKSISKMALKARAQPRTSVAHPCEDVCLVIGAPGVARNIQGFKIRVDRPHVDTFKEWLTVTLDIDPPKDMIRTRQGDLIRDPKYQASMYLRGLLLPSGGVSGKNYQYGYNFIDGTTSSDRDMLVGACDESEGILSIWTAAIRTDKSTDSEIAFDYTNLLLNSINRKGDVMLRNDDFCFEGDIARKVWEKMLSINEDDQGRKPFYYSATEGKDEVHVIEQSLRKNPVPINGELWKMLSRYFICKTPAEELLHRFKSAQVVVLPDDTFAAHVNRMLRCLLQSHPVTRHMELTFVDGEHLDIDTGFFATTWKVHNKWLTWEGAHEHVYCDEDQREGSNMFLCDHAVLRLWDIMISQLIATGDYPRISIDEGLLKSLANKRLLQMPRSVQCSPTERKGELIITWETADLYQNRNEPSSPAVAGGVIFAGLDPDASYFAHVSRESEGAFIALPSNTAKPLHSDLVSQTGPEPGPELVLATIEETPPACANTTEDLINYQPVHVGDDDEDMGDDSGIYAPSIRSHSQSPLRAVSSALPSLVPEQQPVRKPPTKEDLTVRSKAESYTLGSKIQHKSLDWGGSFPGSHDFYRSLDAPDQEIFILKPKGDAKKTARKRPLAGEEAQNGSKKSRTAKASNRVAHTEDTPIPDPSLGRP
ncbi:hypothetical protein DDE82_004547 [Stemphylium lycopersici]|uniref:Uncharacterized protein n=1 Tax=Stemphylium lycopersici TaxID=183478 RepID=A0A364MYM3_STELY|nr:hypothetical protein DDE82_004547 [Stemphylium lycopersici]RAR06754.1 hypothetical protein DDE83_006813 [Stemphylium lycopersici]